MKELRILKSPFYSISCAVAHSITKTSQHGKACSVQSKCLHLIFTKQKTYVKGVD